MLKATVFSLLIVAVIAGCSTEQDAFRDQNENVKDGVPPGQKVDPDRPHVTKDFLRLRMEPEIQAFTEGQPGSFKIIGSVLDDREIDYKIEIKNPLPGFVIDEVDGNLEVSWEPGREVVLGSSLYTDFDLEVIMTPIGVREPIVLTEYFKLFVYKNLQWRPEIIEVEAVELTEGESKEIQIKVYDPDSVDGVMGLAREPKLTVLSIPGVSNDGSSLVRVLKRPKQDSADPYVWIYTLDVNLKGKELTTGKSTYKYGLLARSHIGLTSEDAQGNISAPYVGSIEVKSFVPEPFSTWEDDFVVQEGETKTLEFSIHSPFIFPASTRVGSGDGVISKITGFDKACQRLPGVAECSCDSQIAWKVNCSITWTGETGAIFESRFPISYDVTNKNEVINKVVTKSFSHFIKVVKAPKPPESSDGKDEEPEPNPDPNPDQGKGRRG